MACLQGPATGGSVMPNCPINEQTGDGRLAGRCWFYLPDGQTCPRHGDVKNALDLFQKTGRLTLERENREQYHDNKE